MKEKQDPMKVLLTEEFLKESDEILADIEADESLKEVELPKDSTEKLLHRIRELEAEKAAYEKLSEKDKEALRLGREIQIAKEYESEELTKEIAAPETAEKVVRFTKRKKKLYLMVALVAIVVFAMGMVGVGEAPFFRSIREQIYGEKALTKMNAEREDEEKVVSSGEAEDGAVYREIKKAFDIKVVKPLYLPDETEMITYRIDEALDEAYILYQGSDLIMDYQMKFHYQNQVFGYMTEGELIEEDTMIVDGILVQIQEYRVSENDEVSYKAQFEYQGTGYIFNITTKLSEEEVVKILENLKIF